MELVPVLLQSYKTSEEVARTELQGLLKEQGYRSPPRHMSRSLDSEIFLQKVSSPPLTRDGSTLNFVHKDYGKGSSLRGS